MKRRILLAALVGSALLAPTSAPAAKPGPKPVKPRCGVYYRYSC